MSDTTLLASMVAVESAWLDALVAAGLAPGECAGADLHRLVAAHDCETLAAGAEGGANPVIGLVELLRERATPEVGRWLHHGLTSQDVLDTGLMLATRAVVDELMSQLADQVSTLTTLATAHRGTQMVARTLTQHAAPTTFGAKVATWLNGVVDAYQQLATLTTPVQIGGAGGTLAAATELAILTEGHGNAVEIPAKLAQTTAATLGLAIRMPWHTTRTPVTAAGDALVGCTDAWGRIASDDPPRSPVAGSLSSAISGRTSVTTSDAMRPQASVHPTSASLAAVTGVRVVCHGIRIAKPKAAAVAWASLEIGRASCRERV